jgi:hypothetical protein
MRQCPGARPGQAGNQGLAHTQIAFGRGVAHAACMSSHGLPQFPDPSSAATSGGSSAATLSIMNLSFNLPLGGIVPRSAQFFQAAQKTCLP